MVRTVVSGDGSLRSCPLKSKLGVEKLDSLCIGVRRSIAKGEDRVEGAVGGGFSAKSARVGSHVVVVNR